MIETMDVSLKVALVIIKYSFSVFVCIDTDNTVSSLTPSKEYWHKKLLSPQTCIWVMKRQLGNKLYLHELTFNNSNTPFEFNHCLFNIIHKTISLWISYSALTIASIYQCLKYLSEERLNSICTDMYICMKVLCKNTYFILNNKIKYKVIVFLSQHELLERSFWVFWVSCHYSPRTCQRQHLIIFLTLEFITYKFLISLPASKIA